MAKKGGKQPGAGRPKGGKNQTTLEKERVQAELRQRTMRAADKLWNAQYQKAVGSVMVFRVDEEEGDNGKVKRIHTLVESADEIKRVLDENEGLDGNVGENYYFVTTVPPDNKAIDSMFDRTFGKAQQTVEITDESTQKWKNAVQMLITSKAAKDVPDAIQQLVEVGFVPPSETVTREITQEIGTIG
jgi:hypothetical protein